MALSPFAYAAEKLQKRLLAAALKIVEWQVRKNRDIRLYVYNSAENGLTPLNYVPRSIMRRRSTAPAHTNNWAMLDHHFDVSGGIVVDVGANAGTTVFKFAKDARKVFAVEPHPGNYAALLEQITIRGLHNVETHRLALSDRQGAADFHERESHGIHSLGTHNKGRIVRTFSVETMTLDAYWAEYINESISLLKVDVEGFECDVFRGAKALLDARAIKAIVFEYSPKIHALRNMEIDAPVKLLREYGYEVFHDDGSVFDAGSPRARMLADLVAMPAAEVQRVSQPALERLASGVSRA